MKKYIVFSIILITNICFVWGQTPQDMVVSGYEIIRNNTVINNLTVNPEGHLVLEYDIQLEIKGNISINGTFENRGAVLILSGTNAQTISGLSAPVNIYDLTIKNSSASGVICEVDIILESTLKLDENTRIDVDGVNNDKNFTFKSDKKGTAKIATIESGSILDGEVICQHYVRNIVAWRMMGIPVKNQTIMDFNDDIYVVLPAISSVGFSYFSEPSATDELGYNGWICDIPNDYNLGVEKAVKIYMYSQSLTSGYALIDLKGLPVVGDGQDNGIGNNERDFIWALDYTTSGFDNGGWNLLSNPYLCNIDWNSPDFVHEGIQGDAYATYNPRNKSYGYFNGITGTNEVTQFVPVMGALFLKALGPDSRMSINEHAKAQYSDNSILGYNSPYEDVEKIRFNLKSADEGYSDETAIAFLDEASDGNDENFDVYRFTDGEVNISSLVNEKPAAINVLGPLFNTKSVNFHINPNVSGKYTMSVTQMENFSPSTSIYLIDHLTGESLKVSKELEYHFSIDESEPDTFSDNRLEVVFIPEIQARDK